MPKTPAHVQLIDLFVTVQIKKIRDSDQQYQELLLTQCYNKYIYNIIIMILCTLYI